MKAYARLGSPLNQSGIDSVLSATRMEYAKLGLPGKGKEVEWAMILCRGCAARIDTVSQRLFFAVFVAHVASLILGLLMVDHTVY